MLKLFSSISVAFLFGGLILPRVNAQTLSLDLVEKPFCDVITGPPCDAPTKTVINRTFFSDDPFSMQSGKNAWISINHRAGVGTVGSNQDRALWTSIRNDSGDVGPRYSMVSIQAETTFNAGPGFTWSPNHGPDTELAGGSFQLADRHIGALPSSNFGNNAVQSRTFRYSGTWGSCPNGACWTGVSGQVNNFAPDPNSGIFAGGMFQAKNIRAERTVGDVGIAVYAPPPNTNNRFFYNWGVYIPDYGLNENDWGLRSMGKNYVGQIIINQANTPGSSSDGCMKGALWADDNYIYRCTGKNHIKRIALEDF